MSLFHWLERSTAPRATDWLSHTNALAVPIIAVVGPNSSRTNVHRASKAALR
jgi:hypothetical protein